MKGDTMSWMFLLTVFGLTLGVFLAVIIGMAVGVIFGRKRLTGSCGGLANRSSADGATNCSLCTRGEKSCPDVSKKRTVVDDSSDSA